MSAELVFDFGVLPDFVLLGAKARTSSHESNQRWKLELWYGDNVWQLKHHRTTIEISGVQGQILCCRFARRARGLGYTHLDLTRLQQPQSTLSAWRAL